MVHNFFYPFSLHLGMILHQVNDISEDGRHDKCKNLGKSLYMHLHYAERKHTEIFKCLGKALKGMIFKL